MAVQSKFVLEQQLSVFNSIPCTCYEIGHTWETKCYMSFLQTLRDSLKFSVKVYMAFYTGTFLLKMLKKENRKIRELKRSFFDVIRSSIFLAANGTLFMGGFCLLRYIIGKFYGWHGLAVGTIVGYICIAIERKSSAILLMRAGQKLFGFYFQTAFFKTAFINKGRGTLALYLANLATETLFRMAVSRKLVKPIHNAEVAIFCLASAGFMSLFRTKQGLEPSLQKPLRLVVGNWEEDCNSGIHKPDGIRAKFVILSNILQPLQILSSKLKHCHPRHRSCQHCHSCIYYTFEGALQNFAVGYLVQLSLNFLQVLRGRKSIKGMFNAFPMGLFVGVYNLLFRACNCLLRWMRNKDSPMLHGAISGAVAGTASWFYKSSTISLYFLFKFFEVLILKGIDKKFLPSISHADHHLYALSLGLILHAAVLEPHNIRPAYWKFLIGVSGGRFPYMFRKVLDVYGTHSSLLYPNFIPDLDRRFVKTPAVAALLSSLGKSNTL